MELSGYQVVVSEEAQLKAQVEVAGHQFSQFCFEPWE